MKAIIAAGGRGTRLRPLTFTSNKHLLPIANKPLLLYPLEDIVAVGIKQVGIVVNETQPAIESLLGTGSKWGIKITYITQPQPLGLANVVQVSRKFLGKSPFVYHLGDNIFTDGIKEPFNTFVKLKPDALLTVFQHQENFRLGVPFFDKQGKLIKIVEKPANPPNRFGVPGLYMFNHKVFEAFDGPGAIKPSARGELEITSLYNYMIKKGYRVEIAEVKGQWRDPGKFDDSLEANRLILDLHLKTSLKGKVDKKTSLKGKVSIGKGSAVTNSRIIGPVIIGQNVIVKNSCLGPHLSVADNCQIINSQISDSILMNDIQMTNVKTPITHSLIGKHTQISSSKRTPSAASLTVADNCLIELPSL